jgi:hypothetical protein
MPPQQFDKIEAGPARKIRHKNSPTRMPGDIIGNSGSIETLDDLSSGPGRHVHELIQRLKRHLILPPPRFQIL